MMVSFAEWVYSPTQREVGCVVERSEVWGHAVVRVWFPRTRTVVCLRADAVRPAATAEASPQRLLATIAAARVADALTPDTLLSAIDAAVTPLPHQLHALARAVSGPRVRYLLADEVGLGKTIEAGLILRELKLRGLVRRALVVAPKGLLAQWVSEMEAHFAEPFHLLMPSELAAHRRYGGAENPWSRHAQVVCPMDAIKPLDARRGWSREQVDAHNRERLGGLVAAGWDLIVVDEAHRLAGSTDQVARYRLGEVLAESAPYLLLLSATPHQGKSDGFQRLLSLLDADVFTDPATVSRERVAPYVIRTEKRRAIDAGGAPLFRPRRTQLVPVAWGTVHEGQRQLYEAVTEYVRVGYNRAVREHRAYVGFLMILMQRLVTSSTQAIATALRRRLDALGAQDAPPPPDVTEVDWHDLDGQEQLELLAEARPAHEAAERAEVRALLDLAERCAAATDAKAEALLDWIHALQRDGDEPDLKVLVFTEFVPTQDMLRDFLTAHGFAVACLNGSMSLDERRHAQHEFATEAQVLVSTDAGGEGLNLQFCHVVVNYDLPWNPMRIEQRIGRVDRIGQRHEVRALNFVLQDSVEHRVQEVLATKLRTIFDEFGVDKAGDVLDSVESDRDFEAAVVRGLLDPRQLDAEVDALLALVRERAQRGRDGAALLPSEGTVDREAARRYAEHPLPRWLEQMTVAWLRSEEGRAEREGAGWVVRWPGSSASERVVFRAPAEPVAEHRLLTLEDPRVRGVATALPRAAPATPLPVARVPGLPAELTGVWSLWQLVVRRGNDAESRVFPVFVHDDGRALVPTARMLWDRLLATDDLPIRGHYAPEHTERALASSRSAAERVGQSLFDELRDRLTQSAERRHAGLLAATEQRRRGARWLAAAGLTPRLEPGDDLASLRRSTPGAGFVPELEAVLLLRVEGAG
ncbi:MAG: DEAD/DEAH box helicase family protein [Deltaproteobacteria bacterium]|nr:DEAD/DEAH box helicase family protein [Deltaproteobacteria bacterium]